jgi:hypothetical protein
MLARGDPELLEPVLALFSALDDNRKRIVLRALPRMINFEEFLCLKGYFFIISLFQGSETVLDELIQLLRTVDKSSMAFRQTKLIQSLTRAHHIGALGLLADLCQCADIARHVMKHSLPFRLQGFDVQLLIVFVNMLTHPEVKHGIAEYDQPFVIARRLIREQPSLACAVLANYPFGPQHFDVVLSIGLLPEVIRAAFAERNALAVVHHLLVLFPPGGLMGFADILAPLVGQHPELAQCEALASKLAPFLRNATTAQPSPEPLIEF